MKSVTLFVAGTFCVFVMSFIFISGDLQLPQGWFAAGTHPKDYDMGIDAKITHSGKNSAFIKSNKESIQGFGTLMQMIKADIYLEKRVRMTGFIKADDVKSWAGMWMRVDSKDNPSQALSFDNMKNRSIVGTIDWKKYEIVLDVPANSSFLAFGVLLDGTGQLWFDDIKFEIVDKSVPTTNLNTMDKQYPSEPTNLDFEK